MKSIRRQLLGRLLPPILALAVISVAGLYVYVRQVLTFDFDSALAAKAKAVAAGVRWDDDHQWQIISPDAAAPEFSPARHTQYFQVWRSDGSAALRSASLGNGDIAPVASPAGADSLWNLALPDGRAGRAVAIHFVPTRDEDDVDIPSDPRDARVRMVLVLAESRHVLDEPLTVLLTSLLMASAVFIIGVMLIVALAVRRSLQPLRQMAMEAAENAVIPSARSFPADAMPAELAPICKYLNELLGRLQSAFEREHRFSSDVAHELRTPIAELRSVTEVALKYPGESFSPADALKDALQISAHMESLVNALLAMARCESGTQAVAIRQVDVSAIVSRLWNTSAAKTASRQLRVESCISDGVTARTDPTLLESILANLISNAVEYSPPAGRISCRLERRGDAIALEIANVADQLTTDDVAHLFEPFWRKDSSRSGGDHCGLGLSLASAYAKCLGAELHADMPEPGCLRISLSLPAAGGENSNTSSLMEVMAAGG